MKKFLVLFILVTSSIVLFAQKSSELKVKTFFHCANGKALIEKELKKVEGIYSVNADLETKVVTIQYDEKKQNKESIVAAIEKIGYYTEFSDQNKKINKACSHGDDHQHDHHE
ncbi:MAG: heavy-metal-associated domain-containing protein [Bacteroidales bacterium]|nr:heavy-metal-associated domain-containing protein [Bacteroidales bacterium]